ncbi:HNH endonuclease [Plesiomonas shigelloides]|uniref:HNH endonuclease n=1 Tax=Plesiomonas shigelloides TaxID=703 RepID=UPI00396A6E34
METHHIVWLSKGEEETITNTVAVCPNCHKKHIQHTTYNIQHTTYNIQIVAAILTFEDRYLKIH